MALCPGLPGWAGTRKIKPIWILLKQESVSGRGISWAICKSAPRSRQITTPAPHHSVFYGPDALHDSQPTASKQIFLYYSEANWSKQSQCTDNVLQWYEEFVYQTPLIGHNLDRSCAHGPLPFVIITYPESVWTVEWESLALAWPFYSKFGVVENAVGLL